MEHGSLKALAWAPLPVKTELLHLNLLWHDRYDDAPSHQWMRQRIQKTVSSIIGS